MASGLTHLTARNQPTMVDVGGKQITRRTASAEARIRLPRAVLLALRKSGHRTKKGPVFDTAIVAGVMAAKRTHELIPLCHPLPVSKVEIDVTPEQQPPGLVVRATVKVTGQTGVEMEALMAVSVACLTIYDMVKAVERGMRIEDIHLVEKRGGKSGHFRAGAKG
jgi:cyclic pyranopterin phosphate synthase